MLEVLRIMCLLGVDGSLAEVDAIAALHAVLAASAVHLKATRTMNFTALEPRHDTALRAFNASFAKAGEPRIPAYFLGPQIGIAEAVKKLTGWERGEGVPDGFVASTTRFLESEGQLLGVYNFRQQLTEALRSFGGHVGYSVSPPSRGEGHAKRLLRHALLEAKRYGVARALLTCSPDNLASRAVIEACGGVFQDTHVDERTSLTIERFWAPTW
ncbi:MAG: putative acetyltransferase [Bradymonadia bacterium]